MEHCPICNHSAEKRQRHTWFCKQCGSYVLGDYVIGALGGEYTPHGYSVIRLRAALFYYLRVVKKNHLHHERRIYIVSERVDNKNSIDLFSVYKLFPQSFSLRLDMVMELLSTAIDDVGKSFELSEDDFYPQADSLKNDMFFMPSFAGTIERRKQRQDTIRLLTELGYINLADHKISFTFKGWEKIDCLQRQINSQTVFIAMSFDFNDPIIALAKECIEQAITTAGYIPRIISEKEHNNSIMDEILYEIDHAAFIVADLTGQKSGVYYEAGYAKASGKEVIFSCHKDDFSNRHFDIIQVNTIKWAERELFIRDLVRRIEITVGLNENSLLKQT